MKLFFQEYGSGPVLVVLHGFLGSLDNWHTMSKRFGATWRVLNVDQRNHGRSPRSDLFTYDAMANDIAEFLDDLKISSASVLGHSMGGKTAMQFALSYPDRVDKLIVVDIAPRGYPRLHDEILDALLSIDLRRLQSRQQVEDQLSKKIPDVATRQFVMKNFGRTAEGSFSWKANLEVLNRGYVEIAREIRSQNPFLKPALFVRSNRSHYLQDSDVPAIKAIFPKAEIVGLDVGHWIHAEAPDLFFEIVQKFLLQQGV